MIASLWHALPGFVTCTQRAFADSSDITQTGNIGGARKLSFVIPRGPILAGEAQTRRLKWLLTGVLISAYREDDSTPSNIASPAFTLCPHKFIFRQD